MKIDAKMAPKNHQKSTKIDPRGAQGRLIHRFYRFWTVSKNGRFFDGALGRQKVDQNRPWGGQGSISALRVLRKGSVSGAEGPQAGTFSRAVITL